MGSNKLSDTYAESEGSVKENLLTPEVKTSVIKSSGTKIESITYSEALDTTNFGFFNYFVIFISGMVLAAVLLETATVGFILPIAQCDLNLTNEHKGAIMAIGYIGIIFSSHLWGFLADTKGRKTVILPTLLATFVFALLSSFSNSFWMMLILRFFNGFLISGGSATIYAYLGEFHTDRTRSRAMMGAAFVFAIGAMFVPVLAFLVINRDWVLPMEWLGITYKPWRLFLVTCSIPGFLSGLSFYLLPESPKFLLSQGKEKECADALQQMYKWNGGKDQLKISHILPDNDTITGAASQETLKDSNFFVVFFRSMWNQTVPLFSKKYLRTTLIACTLQFWLYVATNGMYMWFPEIINSMAEFMKNHPGEPKQMCHIANFYHDDGGMRCVSKLEHQTYAYSLTMEILYAISFAIIGLVINRMGKRFIIFLTTTFFTLCGLIGVLIYDPAIAAYLYVLFFLVGVAINVLGAVTVELYPTHLRAMAICISLMVGRLGSVIGANIVGVLLRHHCELTFYVTCGWLFFCAILVRFLPKNKAEDNINLRSEDEA